jgi:penicillin-binding protein 1C
MRLGLHSRARKSLFIGLAVSVTLPLVAFAALWLTLPPVDQLHRRAQSPSTKILDRNGRLLYEIIDPRSESSGRHTPAPLARIPFHLRNATIAVEDANFYTNPGVDIAGITRALWINLRGGEALAGGSTITQQLARMLLLDPQERTQRTLLRKIRESLLAWQIAQRYSKDEVLALYLNEAYYGNLAYGVEAAAHAYFGKSASELDLAECALLAGLPQSPASYDPYNDPELAVRRQRIVLDLMVRQGVISEQDALIARQSRLSYAPAPYAIRAPHFVSYVRNWLEREFGAEAVVRGGLIVTTTLDLGLNEVGLDIVRAHLRGLDRPSADEIDHNANNAALVAIDPRTGEILAMVGSPDYFDAGISGAVNAAVALRQPGSAIKPVTYATAFAKLPDFTAATPILDVRTAFPTREGLPYVPVNYDYRHHGPISARSALATSNNVAAVSVLARIGVPAMIEQANALGLRSFKDANDYGLALTLGGGEVRLIELTAAYGAFANDGQRVDPFAVLAVSNANGEPLFNRQSQARPERSRGIANRKSVIDPRIAWLITDILSDNTARAAAFGQSSVLRLSRPAAVKTGTTTDFRDNWTIGYTPQIVTGVWVGNASGESMRRVSGVAGAGPIWHDFMEAVHRGKPVEWFTRPDGLMNVEICALSGKLPTSDCAHTRREWFIEGTQPRQRDDWYRRVKIDVVTGQPASGATPAERVVERVMLDLPVVARDWARKMGWPVLDQGPVADFTRQEAGASISSARVSPVVIVRPDPGTIYRLAPELPIALQQIPIEVYIEDRDRDLVKLEVSLDTGEKIAVFDRYSNRGPYRAFWPLSVGDHVFIARAYLRDGQMRESAPVSVHVLP